MRKITYLACMTETEKFPLKRVRDEDGLIVISVDNAPTANTYDFIHTLFKNNWDYEIIGVGRPWEGFKSKIQYFHEYLRTLNPERLVILSDARDVFCVRSPKYFEKAFNSFGKPVLVSLEIFCQGYPDDRAVLDPKKIWQCVPLNHYWSQQTKKSPFRKYVNSGLIAGKVKDLIIYFNWVSESGWTDDQASLGDYMNKFPDRVAGDIDANVLHTSTFGVTYSASTKKQWEDSPTIAELCGRRGFFLHIPGLSGSPGQAKTYALVKSLIFDMKVTSEWFTFNTSQDAWNDRYEWDKGNFD